MSEKLPPLPVEKVAREAGLYFARDDFGDVPEVEATFPGSLERFAEMLLAADRAALAETLMPLIEAYAVAAIHKALATHTGKKTDLDPIAARAAIVAKLKGDAN